MAASRRSPDAIRASLVRLGHLTFDDFLLLDPRVLASFFTLRSSSLSSDWCLATNNAPHVQLRFRSVTCNLQPATCKLTDIHAAQTRLVHAFALELLKAKAPPLYDALPWHDWDFSIVTRRFPLWKTRFLLAGDGASVTVCKCRKTAGVYMLEPDEAIARYVARKAATEKVRRFHLLPRSASLQSAICTLQSPDTLIPLPDNSVDVAIVGSSPDLQTANCRLQTSELLRVSRSVLLVENSPLAAALDHSWLAANGFTADTVDVHGLGLRPCHWKPGQRQRVGSEVRQ
jgi:hypothetical protein